MAGPPPAVVTVGEVQFDPLPTNLIASDAGIFSDCQVINHFEKDRHLYMMGLTSPGGFNGASVGFAQLASPTLLWIADWTVERQGSQPTFPDPTPYDSTWVLLYDLYEPGQVNVAADGVTPIYRISGTYIYGKTNPSTVTINDINYGRPPWLLDVYDRNVTTTSLQQSLINVVTANGAGKGGLVGGVVGGN